MNNTVFKFLLFILTLFLGIVSSIGLEAYNKINPGKENIIRNRTKQFLIAMSVISWILFFIIIVYIAITSTSDSKADGNK